MGNPLTEFTAVSTLLNNTRLCRVYVFIRQNGPASAGQLESELGLSTATVYSDLETLEQHGLVYTTSDSQPNEYLANNFELVLVSGGESVVVDPQFAEVVALRKQNYSVDMFVERTGLPGVAAVLDTIEAGRTANSLATELNIPEFEAKEVVSSVESLVKQPW